MRGIDDAALPAGPRTPGAGQTVAWGLRPRWFFERCRRRLGPTFTVRFFDGRSIVVITEAADVKALFALRPEEFEVGPSNREILEPFLGPRSLLMLDGDEHRASRRRLQHAFHAERIDGYRRLVVEATREGLATWPVGRPFALHAHMRTITVNVILGAVFGAGRDDQPALRAALAAFLAESSDSLLILLPPCRRELGGFGPWARFVRQRAELHAAIRAIVAERRRDVGREVRPDMLSALLADADVSDEQLLDDLMTLVLAGQDTTATALAWAFDLLVHDGRVLDQLCVALRAGDDDDRYLDAVVHECMRLRPVIGETARTLCQPWVLPSTGHVLPAGTSVMVSVHLVHTDPTRYDAPYEFRPERFLSGEAPDLATWLSLGGGVRRCLGAGLAMLEQREVLREVLLAVRPRAVSAQLERPKRRAVTMMPRNGTRVVLDSSPVLRAVDPTTAWA